MLCPICQNPTSKFGKNASGSQRYRCEDCKKSFTDETTRVNDGRRVDKDKMNLALRMLLEGNAIRAVQRLLGIHRDTIIDAMVDAGERCQRFLEAKIVGIQAADIECDEIWGFVNMKEKTRVRNKYDEAGRGDAWCFTAVERHTKLILAYHICKRTPITTILFAEKLARATCGTFQMTTDGFRSYRTAIPAVLAARGISWATQVKVFGEFDEEGARKYSPAEVIEVIEKKMMGAPDEDRIGTSYVERSNLTLRMQIRRLTRLTNAHSKKWENHEAALAFFFAYYNFCRVHMTLKKTPAQAAGLTEETWSLDRLLQEASQL